MRDGHHSNEHLKVGVPVSPHLGFWQPMERLQPCPGSCCLLLADKVMLSEQKVVLSEQALLCLVIAVPQMSLPFRGSLFSQEQGCYSKEVHFIHIILKALMPPKSRRKYLF